ncbi:MAG: histidine kinase [Oscillatoriales cyanobacterium]|nr:MAG: histidine kinase [Oscillatoriales cyanobacterium]
MQDSSQKIVDYIYEHFYDSETGQNSCALVRLFKTHPYGALEDSLQASARCLMTPTIPVADMKCWTLLAAAGKETHSNYSLVNKNIVIPLVNQEFVAEMPGISEMILRFGLDIPTVLGMDREKMLESEHKLLNAFYISNAKDSPFIGEQDSLIIPYGVKSVLGIGGLLPSGSLFVVMIFLKIQISQNMAEMLKNLALAIKTSLLPFDDEVSFDSSKKSSLLFPVNNIIEPEILQASQAIALTQLLDISQQEMFKQAIRLQFIISKLKRKVEERRESGIGHLA